MEIPLSDPMESPRPHGIPFEGLLVRFDDSAHKRGITGRLDSDKVGLSRGARRRNLIDAQRSVPGRKPRFTISVDFG